jgi:hypothetical protein
MIVFARGSITNPDELAPFVDDEMRVIKQRKDDGVIKTVYRRAAGPGTFSTVAASATAECRNCARGTAIYPPQRRWAGSASIPSAVPAEIQLVSDSTGRTDTCGGTKASTRGTAI